MILLFVGVMIGLLVGEIVMALLLLMYLHHRWYGTYKIKLKNLPFSTKLKENFNINVELK